MLKSDILITILFSALWTSYSPNILFQPIKTTMFVSQQALTVGMKLKTILSDHKNVWTCILKEPEQLIHVVKNLITT